MQVGLKNDRPGIRRTSWRLAFVAFSFALHARAPAVLGAETNNDNIIVDRPLILERTAFADFNKECRSLLRSAWGTDSARKRGVTTVHRARSCPSLEHVSTAGRSLLIAANLVPSGTADPCWDPDLAHAAERACGAAWRSEFRSDQWHPHAEGRQYVPGTHVYVLAASLALTVTGLLLLPWV